MIAPTKTKEVSGTCSRVGGTVMGSGPTVLKQVNAPVLKKPANNQDHGLSNPCGGGDKNAEEERERKEEVRLWNWWVF